MKTEDKPDSHMEQIRNVGILRGPERRRRMKAGWQQRVRSTQIHREWLNNETQVCTDRKQEKQTKRGNNQTNHTMTKVLFNNAVVGVMPVARIQIIHPISASIRYLWHTAISFSPTQLFHRKGQIEKMCLCIHPASWPAVQNVCGLTEASPKRFL